MSRFFRAFIVLFFSGGVLSLPAQTVSLRWSDAAKAGEVTIIRGKLEHERLSLPGTARDAAFAFLSPQESARELTLSRDTSQSLPLLVTVKLSGRPFTFNVADVMAAAPIYLPADGVIVTTADDRRSFPQIVTALQQRHSLSKLQRIEAEPEESFAAASARVREIKSETWLGLSRDMRMFRINPHLDGVQPRLAGRELKLPESPDQQIGYEFGVGRGWGVRDEIKRQLDEGTLPILQAKVSDETIDYELTSFVTLEQKAFVAANLVGTDYLIADVNSHGHSLTPAQYAAYDRAKQAAGEAKEETVLRVRIVAHNRGTEPRHAFFRVPFPIATVIGKPAPVSSFDSVAGIGRFASGRAYVGATLNGQPAPGVEATPLLAPGASATLEFVLPHSPISAERMAALLRQSFATRLAEAQSFWQAKLAAASQWRLPETRIQNMIQAGLLHLDLVAYGLEPNAPVLPAIGIYAAIGSESAPIIQFMDSMGWHDTARRAIDYFLAKQRDDGFMQNFNGYMLETGAVLWTMGEHYRYTRDDAWLLQVHPKLTLACNYLQAWRKRNLQTELVGDGYGMLDGKTADPEDPYRSFMLNGYAYLGLARAAEMLRELAPEESALWQKEAETLKTDILASLRGSMERAPVVPLGDGTWSRTAAPWTGYRGPVALHADGGRWYTHWTITGRDSLLGPLYTVFQELLDPKETAATEILQTQSELFLTSENVAFSQPYYSRHPWVHLRRNEPKPFLKAWYNSVASLADRETYSFTEHFFPVSDHKTHEEAWFLMETRWMLYLEEGKTLKLLAGVPRDYLKPGQSISVDRAASYFGELSFKVDASAKTIRASISCASPRHPEVLEIRLPHPEGKKPVSVKGGEYLPERETIRVAPFNGSAEVSVEF